MKVLVLIRTIYLCTVAYEIVFARPVRLVSSRRSAHASKPEQYYAFRVPRADWHPHPILEISDLHTSKTMST